MGIEVLVFLLFSFLFFWGGGAEVHILNYVNIYSFHLSVNGAYFVYRE